MLAQKGASDLSFSAVPEAEVAAIAARPDVKRATGFMLEVAEVDSNPFFMLFGYDAGELVGRASKRRAEPLATGPGLWPRGTHGTLPAARSGAILGPEETAQLAGTF